MNANSRLSAAGPTRAWPYLCLVALSFLLAPGCLGNSSPPPEGRLAIENVAKWYQLYRSAHRGKTPPSEEEFLTFVESDLKSKRNVDLNREEFLTSPRDGQKFVVNYGKPTSTNQERNVAVYEREGYDGKKLVGFEFGNSQEVDEAELQSLLAGEG